MPAPRKYPDELKNRAIRLTLDALADPDRPGGVSGASAMSWGSIPRPCAAGCARPGSTPARGPAPPGVEAQRLRELEKEVRELRRANAILRSASAFFAAECERPSR